MRIIRDISQPLIFHSGAVKEEWKENLWKYLFLTVALRRREGQAGQVFAPSLLRAGYFWSFREPSARQLEVLNFREELEKDSSQLTGMPIASLTNVIGVYKKWEPGGPAGTKMTLFRRKLCEITLGEISSETYKELQHFMQDCQLNLNWILAGTEEDLIWKFLRR